MVHEDGQGPREQGDLPQRGDQPENRLRECPAVRSGSNPRDPHGDDQPQGEGDEWSEVPLEEVYGPEAPKEVRLFLLARVTRLGVAQAAFD